MPLSLEEIVNGAVPKKTDHILEGIVSYERPGWKQSIPNINE